MSPIRSTAADRRSDPLIRWPRPWPARRIWEGPARPSTGCWPPAMDGTSSTSCAPAGPRITPSKKPPAGHPLPWCCRAASCAAAKPALGCCRQARCSYSIRGRHSNARMRMGRAIDALRSSTSRHCSSAWRTRLADAAPGSRTIACRHCGRWPARRRGRNWASPARRRWRRRRWSWPVPSSKLQMTSGRTCRCPRSIRRASRARCGTSAPTSTNGTRLPIWQSSPT